MSAARRLPPGARAAVAIVAAVAAAAAFAPPALAAPGVDVADMSGVLLSLALVVGFIFAAAFVLKRTPFGAAGRNNGLLKVVGALPLGPRERLVLVQVRGEELLLAVSPAGVTNVRAIAATVAQPNVTDTSDTAPQFVLGSEA